MKALLVLEDGSSYLGRSAGVEGERFGELCFNTSMVGYPEILSDPSYAGQLITMTYPQIGNYGVTLADLQRDTLALRGLVVRDLCREPSNFRSDLSLPDFLVQQGVLTITDIDTRALTRHIRTHGAMRAGISTLDLDVQSLLARVIASPSLLQQNLVKTVSVKEPEFWGGTGQVEQGDGASVPLWQRSLAIGNDAGCQSGTLAPSPCSTCPVPLSHSAPSPFRVVVYDCGAKYGILQSLVRVGCTVELVPWDTPPAEVLAREPDGVFFSNGPGDPEPVEATTAAARELLGRVPVFGICLGHQILGRAVGAQTEKLKFGHRGGNHPVMDLRTNKVEITTQNHGFGVVFESVGPLIPELSGGEASHPASLLSWVERRVAPVVETAQYGRLQLTHVNLNDGTPEGMAFLDLPAFCVQYHPEASPGPSDAEYLFDAFAELMRSCGEPHDGSAGSSVTAFNPTAGASGSLGPAASPFPGAHARSEEH